MLAASGAVCFVYMSSFKYFSFVLSSRTHLKCMWTHGTNLASNKVVLGSKISFKGVVTENKEDTYMNSNYKVNS